MSSLKIPATDSTPLIDFSFEENRFEIKGVSKPENPDKFYQLLTHWMDNVLEKFMGKRDELFPQEFNLEVNLEYFNSSSLKQLYSLFEKFKNFERVQMKFQIKWYHDKEDLVIKEAGEDFRDSIKLHLDLVST